MNYLPSRVVFFRIKSNYAVCRRPKCPGEVFGASNNTFDWRCLLRRLLIALLLGDGTARKCFTSLLVVYIIQHVSAHTL